MDVTRVQAWGWLRQGLDGSLRGKPAASTLEAVGWLRSVGGAGPYLGLRARAGLSRAEVDAAVARQEIHELPSARGCTYVLPAADFALGLRMGQGFGDDAQIATAKKYLGVTDTELDRLRDAVVASLAAGPLDPRALRERLGDTVRTLGPDGKKRGLTTTLPLALGWLQSHGEIRRIPLDGRLDRQRYAYARWAPNPLAADTAALPERHVDLARRYFRWAGPATLAHFQGFSGLGVKDSKAAVAGLGLVDVGEGRLLLPEDVAAFEQLVVPAVPQYAFLANTDALFLHRRELGPLFGEADRDRKVWTEKGQVAGGALTDLEHQAIVDRGRIVGLWDWDGLRGELVWKSFSPADDALRAEAARTEAWIRAELGDVRSFSLDSPESRVPRLEALRAG